MISDPQLRRWWLAIGWLLIAAILGACLMPNPPPVPVVSNDKLHHLAAFAALTCWWRWLSRRWWTPVLLLAGLAGLVEVLQDALTTTRHAEWRDWYADLIGIGLGLALAASPLRRMLPWVDRLLTSRLVTGAGSDAEPG